MEEIKLTEKGTQVLNIFESLSLFIMKKSYSAFPTFALPTIAFPTIGSSPESSSFL